MPGAAIGRLGIPAAGYRCRGPEGEPGHTVRLDIATAGPQGRVAVVTVAGEIDLRTVDVLRSGLLELADAGFLHFVVDFEQVRFCDATGLGALVAAYNRVCAHGGEVRLSRVRAPQRKLFAVTGLDRLFTLHDSVADAVGESSASTAAPQS